MTEAEYKLSIVFVKNLCLIVFEQEADKRILVNYKFVLQEKI